MWFLLFKLKGKISIKGKIPVLEKNPQIWFGITKNVEEAYNLDEEFGVD